MAHSSILLKGGKVVLHDANDAVTTKETDILIEGNKIAKIAPSISASSSSTRVIDCKNRLISPGFIDTHRHLWQTQLKGRHVDETLMQYLPTGNMASQLYSANDVFFGTLGGALESIDAGTTTIVDHAHMVYSSEMVKAGGEALEASGVRAVYCVTPTMRVKEWAPKLVQDPEMIPDWWDSMYSTLAKDLQNGSGRVNLGLGYDTFFIGKDATADVYNKARKLGAKVITSHSVHFFNPVASLKDYGLLGPDILISHFNNATPDTTSDLVSSGGHVSATPSTELQMTHGYPVCFRPELAAVSSLGVDCHSATSASLVSEMRLAIQHARSVHNQPFTDAGGWAGAVNIKAVEVFNLATIKGARAIGMEKELGSIAEGKLADLIIWDTTTPGMVAAAEHDAVAAILLHSSVRDVDSVLVDGVVRKEGGRLLPVEVKGKRTEWAEIARELVGQRKELQAKVDGIDYQRVYGELAEQGMPVENSKGLKG